VLKIDLALQALLGATEDQARAKATVDTIRGRLEEAARERTAQDGAAPTWKSPGYGAVRWDVPAAPVITVTKPEEFASFLAERQPDAVTATITVPAAQLEQALSALGFSGITDLTSAVTAKPGAAEQWLTTNAEIVGTTEGFVVRELVDQGGELVQGSPVIGVIAALKQPRLVVTLDAKRKQAAAAAGVEAAADTLEDAGAYADNPVSVLPSPRPEPDLSGVRYSATQPKAHLVTACVSAGLPSSGTRAQLADRLNGVLDG
jgi:post-segregation antitoxin (ccd killing protein)